MKAGLGVTEDSRYRRDRVRRKTDTMCSLDKLRSTRPTWTRICVPNKWFLRLPILRQVDIILNPEPERISPHPCLCGYGMGPGLSWSAPHKRNVVRREACPPDSFSWGEPLLFSL